MLMADPGAALSETRRVLHSGGPLAFAVWAAPERNPWAALPAKVLVERGHMPPPEPGSPGIFAMADPERIRDLVTGAGFGEPELEEIGFEFRYADADDLWDTIAPPRRPAGPRGQVAAGGGAAGDPRGDRGEPRTLPRRGRVLRGAGAVLGRARSLSAPQPLS